MTRQHDIKAEERESARITQLVKALEFELVGALESQGMELRGFAVRYDAFNCLMTIKVDFQGDRKVAFVGSDTIMNCIIKASNDASYHRLKWSLDKYHTKQS